MRILTIGLAMMVAVFTATTAHAEEEKKWWDVETDHETTAEIRGVFVPRLKEHRREVREVRKARREAAAAASIEPTPTYSSSTSVSGCLSDEAIASYARAAGFPESVIPTMVYIAAHRNGTGESGGCPGAVNGGGEAYAGGPACGLWQLWPCPGPAALDPAVNAAGAYEKYVDAGYSLSPWSL